MWTQGPCRRNAVESPRVHTWLPQPSPREAGDPCWPTRSRRETRGKTLSALDGPGHCSDTPPGLHDEGLRSRPTWPMAQPAVPSWLPINPLRSQPPGQAGLTQEDAEGGGPCICPRAFSASCWPLPRSPSDPGEESGAQPPSPLGRLPIRECPGEAGPSGGSAGCPPTLPAVRLAQRG